MWIAANAVTHVTQLYTGQVGEVDPGVRQEISCLWYMKESPLLRHAPYVVATRGSAHLYSIHPQFI